MHQPKKTIIIWQQIWFQAVCLSGSLADLKKNNHRNECKKIRLVGSAAVTGASNLSLCVVIKYLCHWIAHSVFQFSVFVKAALKSIIATTKDQFGPIIVLQQIWFQAVCLSGSLLAHSVCYVSIL